MFTPVSFRRVEQPCQRTIIVGDIHGCWSEFQQLVATADFREGDLLVSVGDFLDRGPDSWAVARFFRDTPNAFSVIGNHERRVAGVVRGRSQPAWSQKQSLSLVPEGKRGEWAGWLEALPAVIETPHVIVTHARLDPARPLTEQDPHFTAAVGGPSVTIELDGQGVPLWFRQMQFQKPVCMGHIGYDRVALVPYGLYALDTRAVYAGQLTAVVFPDGDVLHVPAARNYHQEAYKAWRMSQLACSGDPMTWSLTEALKVLNAREDDKADFEGEIRALANIISALGIEGHGRLLRTVLQQRFGEVPAPGPERGEYFRTIKRAFSDWGVQSLAARLMKENPVEFNDLAVAFPNAKLCDAVAVLTKLKKVFLQDISPLSGQKHCVEFT
jgi:serine/threonine protein phosphatase 1